MNNRSEMGFYQQHARYYDAIYHWKDYGAEARRLHEILIAEGIADRSRVIDAACGTGNHLVHLQEWYDVAGFDASPHMLKIAQRKLPGAPLWQADITSFELDKPADAVLCLFSSISYVFPEDRLRIAAARFARAVRPGGLIIIEPWIDPAIYIPDSRRMHTYDGENLKLCRIGISNRETREGVDLAVLDFYWLALEAGVAVAEHFTERHVVWLCTRAQLIAAFADAGFEARLEPNGLMRDRGLIIGRRTS